jgi:hypothetical protein
MINLMLNFLEIGVAIYAYCTDFVINLANLCNLSYYEVNAWIFCIIWPLVTVVLLIIRTFQILKNFINRKEIKSKKG